MEVAPAPRHSRARFLVLIPLVAALAALAFVATVPLSTVSSDEAAQALPAAIMQPVAAPTQATPAITASPSPAAAAAEILAAPPITVLPPPPPPPKAMKSSSCSSSGTYASYECANLRYLNQARASAGLSGLTWSSSLAKNARIWSTYLADNNITAIYHSTIWRNGENIYYISGGSGDALALRAHNAFMGSQGHKDNILRSSFRSVGIGVAHGPGGWYVVQNFSN